MNPLSDIMGFLHASPFHLFAVITSDGRQFQVLPSDSLTVTARGKLLFERDERTAAWADMPGKSSFANFSPLHVVNVEALPHPASA